MRTVNLHDALLLVQSLRHSLIEGQVSRGLTGPGRVVSGCIALLACMILSTPMIPSTPRAHLLAWGVVLLLASLINGFSLLYFYLNDKQVNRDIRRLRPLLDALPPLAVGAGLTVAFVLKREPDPLCGIWMCMFGLVNLASRNSLPSLISFAGMFYIAGGLVCLILPGFSFTNPWPMGIVFFTGELTSGLVLMMDRRRLKAVQALIPQNHLST